MFNNYTEDSTNAYAGKTKTLKYSTFLTAIEDKQNCEATKFTHPKRASKELTHKKKQCCTRDRKNTGQ